MAYPGPPRRAGGLVRWLLLGAGVLAVLFYIRSSSLSALHSAHQAIDVTPSHLPTIPIQAPPPSNPFTTGRPAPISDAHTSEQDHKPSAAEEYAEKQKLGANQNNEHQDPVADVKTEQPISKPTLEHPIDTLIAAADKIHGDLLKKESKDLKTAAAEYRRRRGRHPPPGFDTWFKFAQDHGAIMVEEFWDQIYHDLGPFWGLPPATMRHEAWDFEMGIKVRNKNASANSEWFWTQIWLNMTQTIEHLLPDMDIALNAMDEPRIVLPWEQVDKFMEIERSTRSMAPPGDVVKEFSKLSDRPDPEVVNREKNWAETCMFLHSLDCSASNTFQCLSGNSHPEDATLIVAHDKQNS